MKQGREHIHDKQIVILLSIFAVEGLKQSGLMRMLHLGKAISRRRSGDP